MSWRKQTNEPLFPDLLWSKPETRHGAGKLLIIGGNAHAIAAPVNAYNFALDAGVGSCRVLLPDHVQKAFGKIVHEGFFAPSNPSGGFAKRALDEWLVHASWSDGVLLAGDFGHNSETAALLETFLSKHNGLITITQDAVENIYTFAERVLQRENTLLVVSFAQAQRLCSAIRSKKALQYSMALLQLVEALEEISKTFAATLVVRFNETLLIASNGEVVSTPAPLKKLWRVEAATKAAVWWLQSPSKPLEATASSYIDF